MFMCAWDFSNEKHPSYHKYAHRLSKGWMLGREVDNSDSQYASFRNNIPVLLQVGLLHLVLSHLVQRFQPRLRPLFSLVFSLVFLSIIHGASVLKIIAIVVVNFAITASLGTTRLGVGLTWLWSLGALFMNDMYRGYEFAALHPGLGWLDQVNGINMRWWITFNFSTLRMISYSMDYYWMSLGSDKASSEMHRQICSVCSAAIHPSEQCDTARTRNPHPRNLYSLINYLAYLFYVPLYLAGPIITFNDFVAQLRHAPRNITAKSTLIYALRWAGTVLCMEWLLHTVYVVAIKDTRAWAGFSPFQMSMVGYFNLKLIWLKLLIIWRFFRLWATADLISCPENMTRCMSNNYSCIEFWRSWHRSYNRWMVRYLYIPLGGSKYYALNIWPVFTFVAIWHDISLKLLTWGWLVAGFILPEVAVRKIFATEQWRQRIGATLYRHIAATAGVLNILMMMTANLVGFALGVDGIKEMIGQIWNASGILFLLTTFVCVFSAVQVMFEIRREEERRGNITQ
ncbi:glycerol transporter [Geranomyces variabilis]|uniref:Glycerol transporter n=1 Tax=Geranomyces variabilis TaxID=109894 RepID=A0AAD5XPY6_9FUNG|nr:glycerol transporter [Geranomyces variabilis]